MADLSQQPSASHRQQNTSYLQSAEERRPRGASRGFAASSRRRDDREGSVNDPRERGRGRGRSRSRSPTDDYNYDRRREHSTRTPAIHPQRQHLLRSRSRSPLPRRAARSRSPSSPRWAARISPTPSPSRRYQQKHQQQQRDWSQEALDRLRWTPSPVRGGSGERAGRGKREDTSLSEGEIQQERAQQQQQPARRSRWDENEREWEQRRQRDGSSNGWRADSGKRPQQQQEARVQRRRPIDSPEPVTGVAIRGSSNAREVNGASGSNKRRKSGKRGKDGGQGDGRCRL